MSQLGSPFSKPHTCLVRVRCYMICSDGSLLADRHGFSPLEKRSEMISVPVIMTAMNLLSTDAHPRSPLL